MLSLGGCAGAVVAVLMAIGTPASAADEACQRDLLGVEVCAGTTTSGFDVLGEAAQHAQGQGATAVAAGLAPPDTVSVDRWAPACSGNGPLGGDLMCAEATTCPQGGTFVRYFHWVLTYQLPEYTLVRIAQLASQCRAAPPGGDATVTPDLVLREMRRLPLRGGSVIVEPHPTTLVNFATAFAVQTTAQAFTVTLLGQSVQVLASPTRYLYVFGDGATFGPTADAGSRYPNPSVTHTYRQPAEVLARVDITYRGEFRVAGGPWIPVPGTVTITGTEVPLRIRQAPSVLVAG